MLEQDSFIFWSWFSILIVLALDYNLQIQNNLSLNLISMNEFTTPNDERNWAMFCHLASFSGAIIPFGHVVGPLILWSMKKNDSELVDREGKKSINFQLSMSLYFFISALLLIVGIGVLLLIGLALLNLIFVILAIVKTLNGEDYQYPLSINFLK